MKKLKNLIAGLFACAVLIVGATMNLATAQDAEQASDETASENEQASSDDEMAEDTAASEPDDTFVPSQEVSSDSSISFPVDI